MTGLRTGRANFAGHGGDRVDALLALPPAGAGPWPGLLLIHGVSGLERRLEDLALRLAAEGFAVLAPDLAAREGQAPARLPEPTDRRAVGDLEAGLAFLAGRGDVDGDRLAAVGLGQGGTLAFLLACASRRLRAAVDCQGSLVYPELSPAKPIQPLDLALNLSCPVQLHLPGREAIPAEAALSRFAKSFEIEIHEGAVSGFLGPASAGYHGSATWDATLRFLREHLQAEQN